MELHELTSDAVDYIFENIKLDGLSQWEKGLYRVHKRTVGQGSPPNRPPERNSRQHLGQTAMKEPCSNTHPIETLQTFEVLKTHGLTCRWRDTTISLVETLDREGNKYLSITVAGATGVELTPGGSSATWTISKAASDPNDAGASNSDDALICDGAVSDATGFAT